MEKNNNVTFKDLIRKEVINICNGKKLGNIFDAELDIQCNRIVAYLIKERRIEFFKKEQIYRVPIRNIKKIGKEIILVEINSTIKECVENVYDEYTENLKTK